MTLAAARAEDEEMPRGNKPLTVELEPLGGGQGEGLVPVFRLGGKRALVGRSFISAVIDGREYQGIIKEGKAGKSAGDGEGGGLAFELTGVIEAAGPGGEPQLRELQLPFRIVLEPSIAVGRGRLLEAKAEVEGPAVGGPVEVFFRIGLDVNDGGEPRWLIPGLFYKHNRSANCMRRYPRFSLGDSLGSSAESGEKDDFVSNSWSFRADRTALPFVFCWTDARMSALGTDELFEVERAASSGGNPGEGESTDFAQAGLCFGAGDIAREAAEATRGTWAGAGTRLGLRFPYGEGPVKHVYFVPEGSGPVSRTIAVGPGDKVRFRFYVSAGPRDLHGYDDVIRHFYARNRRGVSPTPWLPKARAEETLAYGQYHWFYDAQNAVLYETSPFDRYFSRYKTQVDRPHMHVGWVSGAAYAYALLKHGDLFEHPEYREAGEKVLDKIASGLAPCGAFWAEWTVEKGWGAGWNPDPHWIQARTVAEATYFLLAAAEYEKNRRPTPARAHADWERAAKSNLDFAVACQRDDGNLGSYYHVESGEVQEWDGAAGFMWIPALAAGLRYFADERYLEAARRAGRFYARFIEDEYIYGAPEDVHLTPTSEDGYNALLAYMSLGEVDGFEPWLKYARRAAEWMLSFRWTYNTLFPRNTILGQYDYQTFGGDVASPANHHLHNYGLICHPALLRLWEVTRDDYYLERAIDHLLWSHQFIAREDGDFNARKGMMSEQWFHTDWTHPKGSMLQLAHVWPAGWVMYADQFTREFGDIIVDLGARRAWALEAVEVSADFGAGGAGSGKGGAGDPVKGAGAVKALIRVKNPWESDLTLTIRVYADDTATEQVHLGNSALLAGLLTGGTDKARRYRVTVPAKGEWSGTLLAARWNDVVAGK